MARSEEQIAELKKKIVSWRWLKVQEESTKKEVQASRQVLENAEYRLGHIQSLIAMLDSIPCKRCAGLGKTHYTISHDMDDVEHGYETCYECKGGGLNESALGNISPNNK
jgi:hypothetical protein